MARLRSSDTLGRVSSSRCRAPIPQARRHRGIPCRLPAICTPAPPLERAFADARERPLPTKRPAFSTAQIFRRHDEIANRREAQIGDRILDAHDGFAQPEERGIRDLQHLAGDGRVRVDDAADVVCGDIGPPTQTAGGRRPAASPVAGQSGRQRAPTNRSRANPATGSIVR